MATADVPTVSGLYERDEDAMRQREIISRCFSEARRKLDEREAELSRQLEQKLRENQIHKKKLLTDRQQLISVSEHIQANLSSNSLQVTGIEAVRLFEQKIGKLKEEERRVQFDWSPQQLYSEICKIGDFSFLPAITQVKIPFVSHPMATADVPINSGLFERDEDAIRQREIISRCFSEARRKLDEREAELSRQLEQKLRENQIHKKKLLTDRQQLISVSEHIQASLSSNSLQETGNEAVRLFEQKIEKLKEEERRVQFDWSPQELYSEISKIGDFSFLPAVTLDYLDPIGSQELELPEVRLTSYDKQRGEIHSFLSQPLMKGQKWYLIHIRWFKQWKRYVGYDNWDKSNAGEEAIKPGHIDNTPLLDHGRLRRHQVDEDDYKLVPSPAWDKLISWYGITVDSVGIKREVVEYGKDVKQCKIEVYPFELKACIYPKENESKTVIISRVDTIHTLDRKIRESYNIGPDKQTRIYNRYMTYTYELIRDMNQKAQDVGLIDGQCVLLEVQNVDGTWPRTNAKRNVFMYK